MQMADAIHEFENRQYCNPYLTLPNHLGKLFNKSFFRTAIMAVLLIAEEKQLSAYYQFLCAAKPL
jgi:hypothetical protein